MYVSSIGNINNAAFSTMQNNNAMMNLARGAGDGSFKDLSTTQQTEKTLQMDNLQNRLTYLASSTIEDSQRKKEKEDIKRSFSTFG